MIRHDAGRLATTAAAPNDAQPTAAGWRRPAVFGAFDGIGCVVGVLLPLLGHPAYILRTAFGVGLAEMVFMAAGEWQSDSDNGFGASLVIGAASGAGAVAPALPFGFLSPTPARWASAVLLLGVLTAIAWLRADRRGRRRAFIESYSIFAVGTAVVWLGGFL